MSNLKTYAERLAFVLSQTNTMIHDIQDIYANSGFETVGEYGFNKTNVIRDLNHHKFRFYEDINIPSLGTVDRYSAVKSIPFKGYAKNGIDYIDPEYGDSYNESSSNTLVTDRSDGNLDIDRWSTRNIFKFKEEYYGYARCVYRIPITDLANGSVIHCDNDTPHNNTLSYYPYPEEIVMISQKSERNFIHFINVQYTDSHYGHYNGRDYNLMIVKDRIRYGVLNDDNTGFKNYTSVYVNDVGSELAYIHNGYLYLPVPDETYGEELLNSLWDCRVIWRHDEPNRNFGVDVYLTGIHNSGWNDSHSKSDISRIWKSICYGNGKFVAVSSDGTIRYSPDCNDWSEWSEKTKAFAFNNEDGNPLLEICYGNGKFVVAGNYTKSNGNTYNYFGFSSDGINWTEGSYDSITDKINSICYGDGKFVACGYKQCAYSTDGISWTLVSIDSYDWTSICYGDGKFVAIASIGAVICSTNGIDWDNLTTLSIGNWKDICYGDGKFVAISSNYTSGRIGYSTDGYNWTIVFTDNHSWHSICYDNCVFITIESAYDDSPNYVAYSNDGISWTSKMLEGYDLSNKILLQPTICYGNDKIVVIGYEGEIIFINALEIACDLSNDFDISNDRIHLINKNSEIIFKNRNDIEGPRNSITTKNSIFSSFNMGINGNILVAPNFDKKYTSYSYWEGYDYNFVWNSIDFDYSTFPTIDPNVGAIWNCGCYGNDKYILLPSSNSVQAYSTNGTDWDVIKNDYAECYTSICYGNGKFVAVGWDTVEDDVGPGGIVGYSTDGINWNVNNYGYKYNKDICYGNGKFVAVGYRPIDSNIDGEAGGNISYSSDGIIWYHIDIETALTSVCYGNGKFVAVSLDNDIIYYSADGITWNSVSGSAYKDICYGNSKFVAIVNNADEDKMCEYSYDGITWYRCNITLSDWSSVCYGDGYFIILSPDKNGYSTDGINWDIVADDLIGFETIFYGNNKFISIGGSDVDYTEKKYLCRGTDHLWLPTGTPNQIFEVTDEYQIGFYYCDASKRGNDYYEVTNAFDNTRKSQLYFGLFDNTFKTVNPSSCDESFPIYPCKEVSSLFNNSEKIIKVFPDNINKKTGISSFFVFTQKEVYKFIFKVHATNAVVTSVEKILTYNSSTPYYVARVGKNEFWIYDYIKVHCINVTDKSEKIIADDSRFLLFGRSCCSIDGSDRFIEYNDNDIYIDHYDVNDDIYLIRNMIGRYLLYKDSFERTMFVKLVEKYTFDTELDPIGQFKWTEYEMTSAEWMYNVCYGNNRFVGIDANIWCSFDGFNWDSQYNENDDDYGVAWSDICFGDDKFVAVRHGPEFGYSYDGITWNFVILGTNGNEYDLCNICYGNGKFIAIGTPSEYAHTFAYSTDGITWTECNTDISLKSISNICFGDDKFVALSYSSDISFIYSFDGIDWIAGTAIIDGIRNWQYICYGNGKFITLSQSGHLAYSTDGITWTSVNITNTSSHFKCICYGKDRFVAIAKDIYAYSYDGIIWAIEPTNTTFDEANWCDICYDDKYERFFVISGSGTMAFLEYT